MFPAKNQKIESFHHIRRGLPSPPSPFSEFARDFFFHVNFEVGNRCIRGNKVID